MKPKTGQFERPEPSKGNFGYFGGKNSESVDAWDAEPGQKPGPQRYQGKKMGRHESAVLWGDKIDGKKPDTYGRTGFQASEPRYGGENESAESMTKRGARIQVSDDVAILGPKVGKSGRAPIDARSRDRIEENAKYKSGK